MRNKLEPWIIWLKQDLQLSRVCQIGHDQLLSSLTNGELFSSELAHYISDDKVPQIILPKDPSKVVVLKKTLNALLQAKQALEALENIDIKSDRYTVGILKEAVPKLSKSIHELFAIVQLVNHSGADVQSIVGPYLSALIPKLEMASDSLTQFTPDHPAEFSGKIVAAAVNTLPSVSPTAEQSLAKFSHSIASLPHYFETLQRLIATGASGMTVKSTTSAAEYQALMIERAAQAKKQFEALDQASYSFAALPSYISIVKLLLKETSDLVSTSAPLTKQAYLDAADKLNIIRHEYLPQLVSEMEQMEEKLCLKPNTFVGPVIKQVEGYYQQLANYVDGFATAVGVANGYVDGAQSGVANLGLKLIGVQIPRVEDTIKPIEHLNVLRDDTFVARVQGAHRQRLAVEKSLSEDNSKLEAAESFFSGISNLNWTLHKWSLSNATPAVKDELTKLYKQFQDDFAAIHPEIDQLIVNSLKKTNDGYLLSKAYHSDYKGMGFSNPMKTIAMCKDSVLMSLSQTLEQSKLNVRLMEESALQRAENIYSSRKHTTELVANTAPFQEYDFQFREGLSSEVYTKKKTEVSVQVLVVESAKSKYQEFSDYLVEILAHHSDNPKINDLNQEEKERLRLAYKEFQPHVVLLKPELNDAIVMALHPSKKDSELRVSALQGELGPIHDHLTEMTARLKQYRNDYDSIEKKTKASELNEASLVPRGLDLEKRTLFGQIAALKLSGKVDEFIQSNFNTFLRDNLAVEDAEKLISAKLPFTEFYKDSPDMIMYKELKNTLFYLHKSLNQVEELHAKGDPSYLLNRGSYIYKLLSAITNVVNAKYYFTKAAEKPGLSVVLSEGLQMLAPFKDLPIIGQYFNASITPKQKLEENFDIVAEWQAQQEILRTFHDRAPNVVEEEEAFYDALEPPVDEDRDDEFFDALDFSSRDEVDDTQKNDTFSQIANVLYSLPRRLRELNTGDTDVSLDHAEEDHAIKAQSEALVKGLKGLSYGPQSLKQLLKTVKEIDKQFSEVGGGARLAIGGLPKIMGESILSVADTMEFQLGMSNAGDITAALMKQCNEFYESVIENVPFKKDQDGLQLLVRSPEMIESRITKEKERLAQLKATQIGEKEKKIESVTGRFGFLKLLQGEQGKPDFQKKFLESFLKIQPDLARIDYRYSRDNLRSFLRQLSTPAQFTKELKAILKLEPKLLDMIKADIGTRVKEIERSNARIGSLNQELEQARLDTRVKIEAFKDKVFDHYFSANILSEIENELGVYANNFHEKVAPDFLERKASLLEGVSLDDDIESVIAEKMEMARVEIMLLHQEDYISCFGLNNLHQSILKEVDYENRRSGDNPIIDEKIDKLLPLVSLLSKAVDADSTELSRVKASVTEDYNDAQVYNDMIKLYAKLGDLKTYVEENRDGKTDESKLAEVNVLRNILTDSEVAPRDRLVHLKQRGESEESKAILTQNSDWLFIKLLKSFWSTLTGWQSANDKKVSNFRDELKTIKDASSLRAENTLETSGRPVDEDDRLNTGLLFESLSRRRDDPVIPDPDEDEEIFDPDDLNRGP